MTEVWLAINRVRQDLKKNAECLYSVKSVYGTEPKVKILVHSRIKSVGK